MSCPVEISKLYILCEKRKQLLLTCSLPWVVKDSTPSSNDWPWMNSEMYVLAQEPTDFCPQMQKDMKNNLGQHNVALRGNGHLYT